MAQEIKLHGGPLHGKKAVIPSTVDVFNVAEMPDLPEFTEEVAPMELTLRKGSYSHVIYSSNDFEWDGWK